MKETVGTTGLIFNEPLLWEKGKTGRTAFSLPRRDVKQQPIDKNLKGNGPDFPDLSEVDIVRHFGARVIREMKFYLIASTYTYKATRYGTSKRPKDVFDTISHPSYFL